MDDPRDHLMKMCSDAELERRWKAAREMMRDHKIDYLVMQHSDEYLGGALRWFTDWTARYQFPMSVVFPSDDEMTIVSWGYRQKTTFDDTQVTSHKPPEWYLRGIKNVWSDDALGCLNYTSDDVPALLARAIDDTKHPVVGWVDKPLLPVAFYESLMRHLPGATFVDATDYVDHLRAARSPEEIEMLRETAAIQDALFGHLSKIIKPGMHDHDIYAEVSCFCERRGTSRLLCLVNSGPAGTLVPFAEYPLQGRQIKAGDEITVLVEGNGPGGQFTELARKFVLGVKPPALLQKAWADNIEGQELVARNLVPGADARDIERLLQGFARGKGYEPIRISCVHAQGYSCVERPTCNDAEPMKFPANSNVAVHPLLTKKVSSSEGVWTMCCDNYLVGPGNGAERVHKFPLGLIEL